MLKLRESSIPAFRQPMIRPMPLTPRGSAKRSSVMTGVYVFALVAIAIAIAIAVLTTVSASARARKEATEAVLLAQMQASLQQVELTRADGAGRPGDGFEPTLSDQQLQEAIADFHASVAELQEMVDADEGALFGQIAEGFDAYVDAVAGSAVLDESGVPLVASSELDRWEQELRSPILAVQLEENEHLVESIEQERRAVLVLQILVPGLLAVAAVLSILTLRSQSRSRQLHELQTLHAAKDEFIASVSHELRTPLSAVVGLAAELRDHLAAFAPAEVEELVALVAEQSQEVSLIVEDLLVSARLDDQNLTMVPAPVELRRQVESAVVPFRGALATGCEVIGEATAYADGGRVRQIVRNLIGNAVRHGGDRVVVRIESGEETVKVVVKDNGPGLPAEEWESIFEAYHRARDVPGLPQSVGLGLTVARKLARQMSGDLSYRYADGWSRFELILPAYASTRPLQATASETVRS